MDYRPDDESIRYSGTEHEYSLFGEIRMDDPAVKSAMRELGSESGYLKYHDSIELAKRFQPGSPDNPSKPFLRDILFGVQDVFDDLGLDVRVGAFTAVGSPLDKYHGADAFLTFDVGGKEFIVTLDATLNPDKQQSGYKADLIIGDLPEPNEGQEQERQYLDLVDAYAQLIAGDVAEKMKDVK